jgi:hypothetical protein
MMSLRKPIFLAIVLLQGYQFGKFKVARPGYVNVIRDNFFYNTNSITNSHSMPRRERNETLSILLSTQTSSDSVDSTIHVTHLGSDELQTDDMMHSHATSASSSTIMPLPTTSAAEANTINKLVLKTEKESTQIMATIIVQLRGEMGNHLSVWSHAKGVQLQLLEEYGIDAELVLRHQVIGHPIEGTRPSLKKGPTEGRIKHCFPNLRPIFDHHLGVANSDYFRRRYYQQASWFDKTTSTPREIRNWGHDLSAVNGNPRSSMDQAIHTSLDAFDKLLRLPSDGTAPKPLTICPTSNLSLPGHTTNSSSSTPPTTPSSVDAISMPFLYVETVSNNVMWNRYYEELRTYFAFDDTACCATIPEPDETVFVSSGVQQTRTLFSAPCAGSLSLDFCFASYFFCHHDIIFMHSYRHIVNVATITNISANAHLQTLALSQF